MIDAGSIAQILSVYKKHGWVLRRVLLSPALEKALGARADEIFGGTEAEGSKLDGLWLSRPSKGTLEAWELRHLSTSPFAMLEVVESATPEDERNAVLSDVEERMIEKLAGR